MDAHNFRSERSYGLFDSISRNQFMKNKWPTLKGRLQNSLKDELTALEQLAKVNELSEYGKARLEKLRRRKKI